MNGNKSNGNHTETKSLVGTYEVKVGLAKMLKGGVIMDVINPEQVIQ